MVLLLNLYHVLSLRLFILFHLHCGNSVQIRNFSLFVFSRIRTDTKYLSEFIPNAGKCGPEKLRIWTLFTQCQYHLLTEGSFLNYSLIKHFEWRPHLSTLEESRKEGVVQRCSVEKVFLEISQNSHENTCARAFFLIKLQA